jgi:hypothetical protein
MRMPAFAVLLAFAAVAWASIRAGAGEPPATRLLADAEYRDLTWEVASAVRFEEKVSLPLVAQVVSLEAPAGTKIAVVDVTLHVPPALVGARDLPIEPGRFLARKNGAVYGARAAGLEVGSGPNGRLWLVANTNQEFNVHLSEATKRLQVVVGVPKDWAEFEVLFAAPIGRAGPATKAAPPSQPTPTPPAMGH